MTKSRKKLTLLRVLSLPPVAVKNKKPTHSILMRFKSSLLPIVQRRQKRKEKRDLRKIYLLTLDIHLKQSITLNYKFIYLTCINLFNLQSLITTIFRESYNRDIGDDIYYFLDFFESLYYAAIIYNKLASEFPISMHIFNLVDHLKYILQDNDDIGGYLFGFDYYFYILEKDHNVIIECMDVEGNSNWHESLSYLMKNNFNNNYIVHFETFYSRLKNSLKDYQRDNIRIIEEAWHNVFHGGALASYNESSHSSIPQPIKAAVKIIKKNTKSGSHSRKSSGSRGGSIKKRTNKSRKINKKLSKQDKTSKKNKRPARKTQRRRN